MGSTLTTIIHILFITFKVFCSLLVSRNFLRERILTCFAVILKYMTDRQKIQKPCDDLLYKIYKKSPERYSLMDSHQDSTKLNCKLNTKGSA